MSGEWSHALDERLRRLEDRVSSLETAVAALLPVDGAEPGSRPDLEAQHQAFVARIRDRERRAT